MFLELASLISEISVRERSMISRARRISVCKQADIASPTSIIALRFTCQGIILFSRSQQILLDQLKYFPRDAHDDGPDALEMALREAEKDGIGFVDLGKKRDRHGRTEDDPDYNRTTPEEDAQDADDEDTGNPFVDLS